MPTPDKIAIGARGRKKVITINKLQNATTAPIIRRGMTATKMTLETIIRASSSVRSVTDEARSAWGQHCVAIAAKKTTPNVICKIL